MKDRKVIVADTRGHGRSTNYGSNYSYDLLAQDYLELLDYLRVQSVHVVGWSDGANVGYLISNTAPDRVASHFTHAVNVTLDGIDPSVETNAVFGGYVGMMGRDYAAMCPTPEKYEVFVGDISKMREKPSGFDHLANITVPTLVLQNEYDESILETHA